MPPPPASGDLSSHPERPGVLDLYFEITAMSATRVFVLHPCIPSLKIVGLAVPKIFGHGVERSGDLDLLTPWNCCGMSAVVPATLLPI